MRVVITPHAEPQLATGRAWWRSTVCIAGAVALTAAACVRPGGPAPVTPAAPAATPAAAPVAAPPALVPAAPAAAASDKVDPAVCYSRDRAPVLPPGQPDPPGTVLMFDHDSALAFADQGPTRALDPDPNKEIIRRIIVRHINEVKDCYESELDVHPNLVGEIVVEFLVPPSGFVSETHVARSTMGDPAVEDCIARAMCGWQFPRPLNDGWIVMMHPYKLTPSNPGP